MIRKRKPSFKPRLEIFEDRLCLSSPSGTVPPGTIYYTDYKPILSPLGWSNSFNSNDSMKADGTAKTVLANFPQYGEPSHLLHGARWILDGEPVAGAYPNGLPHAELFATRLSDGVKVQLTNDPNVQSDFTGLRWAFDDGFVSFPAVTWTPESTGGNFTDSTGQQWLVDAGIFKANVDWTTGSPVAATPTEALDAGLYFGSVQDGLSFWAHPDVVHLDWSPSGTQVVYDQNIEASPGNAVTDYLRLTTFGATVNTIQLATIYNAGRISPEWAPDGSRIAYDNGYSIWTVKPDGTSAVQLTNIGTNGVGVYDVHPDWSPDSKQIAFTESTQTNKGGLTHYLKDVLRVAATGGTPVNLTKDVADNTFAVAWRADVQALNASAIGAGATQTLPSSQVAPLLAETRAPLAESRAQSESSSARGAPREAAVGPTLVSQLGHRRRSTSVSAAALDEVFARGDWLPDVLGGDQVFAWLS